MPSRSPAAARSAAGLARSLAMALDPVVLATAAGVEPDPWQAELLRSAARQILMLCSRQSGKSTVSALLAGEVVDRPCHLQYDHIYVSGAPW